ncbi:hypothetical protein TNCV_3674731 [Trichonephila clavipes]|nr:hypothetical protein TNCV_3674731 [Trichonephila clavipes]
MYRHLGHISLYSQMSVRCVPLMAPLVSQKKMIYNVDISQWGCGMITDEFRLSFQSDSLGTFIWRTGTKIAEFVFMDDNALPQQASIVNEFLQSDDITPKKFQAILPDLKPI